MIQHGEPPYEPCLVPITLLKVLHGPLHLMFVDNVDPVKRMGRSIKSLRGPLSQLAIS